MSQRLLSSSGLPGGEPPPDGSPGPLGGPMIPESGGLTIELRRSELRHRQDDMTPRGELSMRRPCFTPRRSPGLKSRATCGSPCRDRQERFLGPGGDTVGSPGFRSRVKKTSTTERQSSAPAERRSSPPGDRRPATGNRAPGSDWRTCSPDEPAFPEPPEDSCPPSRKCSSTRPIANRPQRASREYWACRESPPLRQPFCRRRGDRCHRTICRIGGGSPSGKPGWPPGGSPERMPSFVSLVIPLFSKSGPAKQSPGPRGSLHTVTSESRSVDAWGRRRHHVHRCQVP